MLDEAKTWQTRPLEQIYPILYLDALVVTTRDGQAIRNFACYLAIGVNLEGERDVLGMWFQRTEGAEFWLQVLTELKTRGVGDVLVCCVDGLTGFPAAIEAFYPNAWVQTCLVRAALRFVPHKDAKGSPPTCGASIPRLTRDHAETELERFAETCDGKYPMISASWIENWERIVPFLAFPPDVRRAVYTPRSKRSRSARSSRPAPQSPPRSVRLARGPPTRTLIRVTTLRSSFEPTSSNRAGVHAPPIDGGSS